ncbi:TetR/AcrR family transcriptional regulator [Vallitalea pronyensis]|uniref:TetR/AcrR family transcriptional regulator n=1 Tax=Vallitalea pronyensis TaxID=1348613 RepID=A0A8J8MPQ9_9FIRM|nr:TetR/AcrR family transcriptional regulator [Vallitalea pronyensis]QUI25296.1 TetR/AcrR family transcriptional regulator [Vallitalea pronyensis]
MTLSKEEKKQLKSERIKRVFATTAKEIIEGQGVFEVSVRKVAEQSGYSLGTIYNHFENLDELLWLTRTLMIEDINHYFLDSRLVIQNDNDLKLLFRKFMDYFINKPNVYYFFYCHPLNKEHKKDESDILKNPQVKMQFAQTFSYLIEQKTYTEDDIMKISWTIIYAIYGLLTLYISGNDTLTKEQVYEHLDNTIDLLLN